MLCAIALLAGAIGGGCSPITLTIGGSPEDYEFQVKKVVEEKGAKKQVAMIDVTGVIMNATEGGFLGTGENPVSAFAEKLKNAAEEDRVAAVVLRINSPGGGVAASDMMYRELERFREMTGKPVVALLMDVAASGGYYLAVGADEIIAYPSSVTGSIGVLFQTVSIKPALERWGVKPDTIVSGPNKAAGSPLSDLSPKQREIFEELVDTFYNQFTTIVRTRRPGIDPDRFGDLTDGRVVTGIAAAQTGLADATGDLYDAFAAAKRRAGIDKADLILYRRPLTYVGSPYAHSSGAPKATHPHPTPHTARSSVTQAITTITANTSPLSATLPGGFYYLWLPGAR